MSFQSYSVAILNVATLFGSCIVKVPQLVRIVQARNVVGISESSITIEWLGYSLTCAYCSLMGYPFATWGEASFLALQSTAILLAYWRLGKSPRGGSISLRPRTIGMFAWLCILRLIVMFGRMAFAAFIGLSPCVLFAVARLPQICLNYQQGHTGQLAPATFFLQLIGNMARIFTTYQVLEGDCIVLLGHGSPAILNLITLLQIAKYRRATNVIRLPR